MYSLSRKTSLWPRLPLLCILNITTTRVSSDHNSHTICYFFLCVWNGTFFVVCGGLVFLFFVAPSLAVFQSASEFNQDVSKWNTGAVTTMQNMFRQASAFNQNVSNWNTGAVTSMQNMFYDSGFTRTLCGGAWGSLTGSISAFYNLGSSTARLGCCSPGTYMAQPNLHPFSEATACAACPSASYGSAVEDDITSCICVAGYWLNEGVCATCATIGGAATVTCTTGNDQVAATCVAGYWLDEGVCTACAFGFVSIEGSSACVDLSQQMDASELRAVFTAMKQC